MRAAINKRSENVGMILFTDFSEREKKKVTAFVHVLKNSFLVLTL